MAIFIMASADVSATSNSFVKSENKGCLGTVSWFYFTADNPHATSPMVVAVTANPQPQFTHKRAALETVCRRYCLASPGTTFITNAVDFSAGPNGPGTLFFTGGSDFRNTAMAVASSLVRLAKARQGMIGASSRPSGRLPVCNAVMI
jgi:hypothetical protein